MHPAGKEARNCSSLIAAYPIANDIFISARRKHWPNSPRTANLLTPPEFLTSSNLHFPRQSAHCYFRSGQRSDEKSAIVSTVQYARKGGCGGAVKALVLGRSSESRIAAPIFFVLRPLTPREWQLSNVRDVFNDIIRPFSLPSRTWMAQVTRG